MEWTIGVQCYGVRKFMEKDLSGAVRKLKETGFDAIEPMVFLQEEQKKKPESQWSLKLLEQMKRETEELGLAIPSVHVNIGLFGKNQPSDTIITGLLDIHKRTGIKNFVFSGMFSSAPAAERWGRLLAEVCAGVRSEGCRVLYHNHSNEFKLVEADGKRMTALDYFYRLTDPEVGLQLDIGWAGFAGDELEIASKYADRIVEIHCKDFYPKALTGRYRQLTLPKRLFAPIGKGAIRTADVLFMTNRFPNFNGAVIIDQDHSKDDIWKDLRTGYGCIRAWADEMPKRQGGWNG